MGERSLGRLAAGVTAAVLLLSFGATPVRAKPSTADSSSTAGISLRIDDLPSVRDGEDVVLRFDFDDPALTGRLRTALADFAPESSSISAAVWDHIEDHRYDGMPAPVRPFDFRAEVVVTGTVVTFTIPASEVHALLSGFWRGVLLALVPLVVGKIIGAGCLVAFPEAAVACAMLDGFMTGMLNGIAVMILDETYGDIDAWTETLGTSLVAALAEAGLAAMFQTQIVNFMKKAVKAVREAADKLATWWGYGWHFGQFAADVLELIRQKLPGLFDRLLGRTMSCPRNPAPDPDWIRHGLLLDKLRELIEHIRGGSGGTGTPGPGPSTGTGTPGPATGTDAALRFADLDGDGVADRILTLAAGRAELAQNSGCDSSGGRVWRPWGNTAPISTLLEQLRAAQVYFGDLDGDDRADYIAVLDAAQSGTGTPGIHAWRNESSVDEIRWGQNGRVANNLSHSAADTRTFVDLDGDSDDDYLVIGANGTVTAWENTARGFPTPADWRRIEGFGHPGEGQAGNETHFADITGDGRADALLLNKVSGELQAWENVGSPWTRTSGWRSLGTIRTGDPLSGLGDAIFGDLDGDRVADLMLHDRDEHSIDAWLLPRYGAGPQGPGQPGLPGFPAQLPPGSLPAYSGGDPRPQVTGRLIQNSNFTGEFKPWWVNAGMTPKVDGGIFCVTAPASAKPWDVIVGHNSIYLPRGSSYTFRFRVRTSQNVNLAVQVAPFYNPTNVTYLAKFPTVTGGAWRTYEYTFDTTFSQAYVLAQVQFRLGGVNTPYEFCMDDVTLNGAGYVYRADRGTAVKVNQHGYLPRGPKRATVVTTATSPQTWTLRRVGGGTVATGRTSPAGFDGSAGASVHLLDFGSVTATGRFELVVGGQVSYPFDIRTDLYASLRTDSMRFFYPNRSGIAIDGGIAGAAYARPAGHVASSPNGGDTAVPCQTPQPFMNNWTCGYTLDVTGGWYDAGDHGKYVVNGGIATYQLLSAWERAVAVGRSGPLGDSTLAIPERGNGVPDILDEARWNLEFMLKMQVPAGRPLAGMAHHKVHDESWTGPPMLPHQDRKQRQLHRPSTAATLNLAAVAAQGARVYAPYDAAFAARLRAAAERAWAAALANPALYAPRADRSGGGPYADDNVTDEFYWAATQLYLTTGGGTYLNALRSNHYHRAEVAFDQNGFYWGSVAALAQLDLARFGTGLSEQAQIRGWVVEAANRLISFQRAERFGQSYTPTSGKYDWGSNASILNNQVVIATAYDLTGNVGYADAVFEAFDYLFGRNALGQSYVTGYGTHDAKNQHSRWYAKSFDSTLPNPPVGSVAGGPNSSLQDPLSAAWLHGCAPQLCYVDNLEAWSVNEITINWNSALAWVSAFAADMAPRR
ncbi:glycoside hydrolase family 9 protein [Polymorphospora rubra]|uniref:glycoside hydrolase family 9 protein n=1 Tax=Polymorphospora rubra TaxID=338584 RepID=UPI003400D968